MERRRDTVRLDGQRLREEREARDSATLDKRKKFTQQDMADLLNIGLVTYQKAEAGDCIDRSIARGIASKLDLDSSEIGQRPCDAAPPADTTAYLEFVREDCGWIDVRGLIVGKGEAPRLHITEIYIPLHTSGADHTSEARDPSGKEVGVADGHNRTLRNRKLVIVGDPGGGKSTYLKMLAYQQSDKMLAYQQSGKTLASQKSRPDDSQFPIRFRISELEDFIYKRVYTTGADNPAPHSPDWMVRFLAHQSAELHWGLDADFFRARLREASTLVLLDGLDEVPNTERRAAIARLFERATKAYRLASFVVTTRPAAYEGTATLADFETVRIGEFVRTEVADFLDRWAGILFRKNAAAASSYRMALLEALKAVPEIRRMSRNPLMLTALAVIQYNEKKLPEQRAALYESILKWLSEAHTYPQRPDGKTCLSIFGTLALGMQNSSAGRVKQVEKAEAAQWIAECFEALPQERRRSAASEFLENEFVDSGIVASRGRSLEFWHLTFQEYLAARACEDLDPTTYLFEYGRWLSAEWREVMLLVPGVLIEKGRKRVHAIFRAMLDRADAAGHDLATQARIAGLMGAMLRDLRPSNIAPENPSYYMLPDVDETRYQALLAAVLGIFDRERSEGIPVRDRVAAAEALGQMGDPRLGPDRDNWITIPGRGYQLGRYLVTVQEFARFMADEDGGYTCEIEPEDWDEQLQHQNRPVVGVNWDAAAAYCAWAGGRLPTDVEWETAASGAEGREYPWGNREPDDNCANHRRNVRTPSPVGVFPNGATPEGLEDMAGNVYEWTSDWHTMNRSHSVRGGCFDDSARFVRASFRSYYNPNLKHDNIGFRCLRVPVSSFPFFQPAPQLRATTTRLDGNKEMGTDRD